MKRAVLAGAGEVVIEEVGRPRAGEGEAVVRVRRAGICGSDIHAYYDRHPFITLPIVQGHEFCNRSRPSQPYWLSPRSRHRET